MGTEVRTEGLLPKLTVVLLILLLYDYGVKIAWFHGLIEA